MKRNLTFGVMIMMIFAAVAVCLAAGSARMINYQGRLAGSGGAPVSGNSVEVAFSIYGVSAGGTALWTEPRTIRVDNGLYTVQLGMVNPIPDNLFNASDRWLGIKVGTDSEMTPRAQITSVAYAMNSQRIAGKKIQSGQGTLTISGAASGSVNITFPVAFASPPQVITGALNSQIGGKTSIVDQVTTVTATGCAVNFVVLDGSTAAGSATFDWIAIGE
jgi:hypothetical protein